ncbi:MAG: chondroitinase-B domain-containing protein [Bacteroidota bacterium]
MKHISFVFLNLLLVSFLAQTSLATTYRVNSQASFDAAQSSASLNDSIIWELGIYPNIFMNITKDNLFIAADTLGGVLFNGSSRVNISSDSITLQGFQWVGGNIGTQDVINTTGSYGHFHQLNIRAYRSYKYLRIRESSQYCRVTYCNFENRINLSDQNILSVLVDANQPGYHKIQWCSFKNFDGTGNDMGIEPIRIGLSTQANRISRTLVEYCYFTNCDGDGELISSKATQNVYRYNTFEDNLLAELVLRHGSEAIVYSNFFLNNKGGVRVREGQNHYIYNNYFYKIDDRPLFLQNEDSDPLDSIVVAFNTVIDSDDIRLGGPGDDPPTKVWFFNNLLTDPQDGLFEEPTKDENWVGNIAFGFLGIDMPTSGITVADPKLVQNSAGFFELDSQSPAIDAAIAGYPSLPQFSGMDSIDVDMSLDIMGQPRPQTITDKDVGCSEYPHSVLLQPLATEENTGPSYNSSVAIGIEKALFVDDLFHVFPNPTRGEISLSVNLAKTSQLKLDIFDLQGRRLATFSQAQLAAGDHTLVENISNLPAGVYTLKMQVLNLQGELQQVQVERLVKR